MPAILRRLLVGTWLVTLSAAVLALGWTRAESKTDSADFGTINAERINIVEPDGKYRLVLANEERFPGNIMGGKEYAHAERGGGMLFFNDEGDEVGGLTTGSEKSAKGYSASSGIMFDQYKQDQVVGMIYDDENGKRAAGLRIWDRPDTSLIPLLEMNNRATLAKSDQERKALRAQMLAYAKAHGGVGASRMFAGKEGKDAVVVLNDPQGHPRLELKVDETGQASITFLDDKGKVTRRIPQIAGTSP
ncbi:MAG TPA: hypothetical protein VJ722_01785 [Rhodanobacteraceae bacterium]|nr:hypothetical protein [Rhodanobacteraceae bacterium]